MAIFHLHKNCIYWLKRPFLYQFLLKKLLVFLSFVWLKELEKSVKSSFQSCVQHEIALRLARDSTAFSTRQHCVLQEIALHFVGDSTAFCYKQHFIQLQKAHFIVKSTDYFNENAVCQHSQTIVFLTQTNLRENRLFASEWRLVSKKGTHNVKIYAEYFTWQRVATYIAMGILWLIKKI